MTPNVKQTQSVVYMCAQSVFKLHPRFDAAVKGVLEASVSNHIVFTEGRNPKWTTSFRARLRSIVGGEVMTRVRELYIHVRMCLIMLLL